MKEETAIDTPAVSVVIPAFNRADLVAATVDSVLQQEHPDPGHEIIVVDDGSSDRTADVLARYGSRIRYVYQENAGISSARNHGLRLARGEFVLFLDSDDVLLPGAIGGMLGEFAGRTGLGAVQGGWCIVNKNLDTLFEAEPWLHAPSLDPDTWVMNTPLFLGGLLCRRNWAERVGGFDEKLRQTEDVDFVLRLALLGCEFNWLRRPIVLYRQHDASITVNALEQTRSMEQLYIALFERPELPDRIRRKKDEVFYYRYAWFAWRLRRSGHKEESEANLHQSLASSSLSPEETVLQWVRLFNNWSHEIGADSEDFSALLPVMRAVVPLNEEHWRDLQQILPWWDAIWSSYLTDHEIPPGRAWLPNQQIASGELIGMVQKSLLITPAEKMVLTIERFLEDASRQALKPKLQAADSLRLYLTAFGQAALARHPRAAIRALSRALRHSGNPQAINDWGRFLANGFRYMSSAAKHSLGSRR